MVVSQNRAPMGHTGSSCSCLGESGNRMYIQSFPLNYNKHRLSLEMCDGRAWVSSELCLRITAPRQACPREFGILIIGYYEIDMRPKTPIICLMKLLPQGLPCTRQTPCFLLIRPRAGALSSHRQQSGKLPFWVTQDEITNILFPFRSSR